MAKLISITQKAFSVLLKRAKKAGALNLAEDIHQSSQPGYGKVSYKAQKEANAKGRVLLLRNDFKNLSRATGLGEGVRLTRKGEFEGMPGVIGAVDEIRALRGKKAFKSKTEGRTTTTFMPRGKGNMEPKKVYRSEEEDMLAFNRAEERSAARTGRRISRRDL